MKSNRLIIISFIGIVAGSLTYYLAERWAAQSVDANIGAGIAGLLGIVAGIVSFIFLIVAIIRTLVVR